MTYQEPVSLCGFDYYQLYRNGTRRGLCHAKRPWLSALDGFGNALGYSVILIGVALVREPLGSGPCWATRLFLPSLTALVPAQWFAAAGT